MAVFSFLSFFRQAKKESAVWPFYQMVKLLMNQEPGKTLFPQFPIRYSYAILRSTMETKILNYRIIVEPDVRTGTNESCFTASCPTLGIADSGDTIEEAIANIKNGIKAWVEALAYDNQPVPVDHIEGSLVAFTSIKAPPHLHIVSSP